MFRAALAFVGTGLLLAGCTAGTETESVPTPGTSTSASSAAPTSTAGSTDEPTADPTSASTAQPTPEPTETATVAPPTEPTETRTVESARLAATIPSTWATCDDSSSRGSSIALDVLGAWALDGDCATGTVLVVEALPVPQGGITAEVYYEQVLVPNAADAGGTLTRELFTTDQGMDGVVAVERGGDEGALFAVTAGELVVRGTLAGPTVDDVTLGAMRDAARTVRVN